MLGKLTVKVWAERSVNPGEYPTVQLITLFGSWGCAKIKQGEGKAHMINRRIIYVFV